MLTVALLLSTLTFGVVGDGLPRSAIPPKDLGKLTKDLGAYFAALESEGVDKDAIKKKQEALDRIQKALAAAAKSAKVDQPLKFLGDWDAVLEQAKPEDKALKAQIGKGFFRHEFHDTWNDVTTACMVSLPEGYGKGDALLPAIVALKPGLSLTGEPLEGKVKELATAAYGPLLATHIVIVPLGPEIKGGKTGESTEIEGSWFTEAGQATMFRALRVLLEQLRFDRARLVLDGWNDAGLDAINTACSFPSWFAGVINRSGATGGTEVLYENLTGIPVLYVNGKTEARGADLAALQARTDLKSEIKVLEDEGSALAPSEATLAALTEWLGARQKDLAPATVHYRFGNSRYQNAHWIKADDARVRANARPEDKDFPRMDATIDRAANKITIETVNVLALYLYLNDSLVDLDKPVTVVVNGKERVKGKLIPRELKYMLDNRFYNNSADYGLYVAERLISEIDPNIPGKEP